ncbi:MAG: BatA domain-containing protein [Planctomycetota bacterium]
MPAFDFAPLLWWGLPLIAAPVLIHLINLLRHRRVRWAAMELLLASQKKYKTRVLLRQLLLLALRTVAVAGIVLALAQPRWRSALGSLLGGGRLHVVLLDDSLSMDERAGGGAGAGDPAAAFDRGRRVTEQVADDAAARGDELAVGLFSHVADDDGADAFLVPRQAVGPEADAAVREALTRARRSWLATGPRAALDRAAAVAAEAGEGGCTLWLVSDFRLRDWADEEAAAAIRRVADAGAAIRLVDCAVEPGADAFNLSITRLEAVGGVPATGVIVPLEVEVRNDGPGPARDMQLELREDGSARPGLQFAEIPPGESVTRRFDVRFTAAGGHVVEARLPADRLPADDVRSCVVEVVDRVEVLLVADEAAGTKPDSDAFYVSTALAPGAAATTGLLPRVVAPAALAAIDLAPFDVIWILDVERLDAASLAALEAHAAAGGGVVFFCGPRTKSEFVNRALFRGGEGLFPLPLAGPVELLSAAGPGRVPDLVAEPHPVVAVLSGTRNPLLDAVRVERVMAVERDFDDAAVRGLRRLLSLRDGRPLVVEKPFGKGLVAAVLTTAAPTWNTWARGNPSWVVVMLELQSQLARQRRQAESLMVGGELRIPLVAGSDEIEVDFLVPPDGTLVRQAATPIEGDGFEARLEADVPGAYAARWRRVDGTERERIVAAHVDAAEGKLERAGRDRLARQLAGVPFRYDAADDLDPAGGDLAGVPLAKPLLLGLLAVLVLEQLAAFAASYHASPVRRR